MYGYEQSVTDASEPNKQICQKCSATNSSSWMGHWYARCFKQFPLISGNNYKPKSGLLDANRGDEWSMYVSWCNFFFAVFFRTCKQQLEKSEMLLRALKVTGIAGEKQAVAVRKSIETRHKQLATLKTRADVLQLKYTSLAGLLNEDSCTVSVLFDLGWMWLWLECDFVI